MNKQLITKPSKRALIVTPNMSDMLQEIQAGLTTTLTKFKEHIDIQTEFLDINNDFDLGEYKFDAMLTHTNFDIIYSLGKKSTQMVKEVTTRNRTYVPTVFLGVWDPVGAGLVLSENYSGNHLTGISSAPRDYVRQMKLLLSVQPHIKKVVFLYDPAAHDISAITNVSSAKQFLHNNGVEIVEMIVKDAADIKKLFPQALTNNVDGVVIFRDNTILSNISEVISICNIFRIPLYTSDSESVKRGAAIGISDFEYNIGVESAKKSAEILFKKARPKSIPISLMPWHDKIIINRTAAAHQNLKINLYPSENAKEGVVFSN